MACFAVPVAEAIVTTIATKVVKSKEQESPVLHTDLGETQGSGIKKISFSRKLQWLSNLLWGGSALLAFEHVWHGEIVPWFPFLTAAQNPADTAEMLHEVATTGVSMAVLVTAVWAGMLAAVSAMEKKAHKTRPATEEGGAQ